MKSFAVAPPGPPKTASSRWLQPFVFHSDNLNGLFWTGDQNTFRRLKLHGDLHYAVRERNCERVWLRWISPSLIHSETARGERLDQPVRDIVFGAENPANMLNGNHVLVDPERSTWTNPNRTSIL